MKQILNYLDVRGERECKLKKNMEAKYDVIVEQMKEKKRQKDEAERMLTEAMIDNEAMLVQLMRRSSTKSVNSQFR